MNSEQKAYNQSNGMKKERFEFFSDAVMAIIMTLMILEIKLPEITAVTFWTFLQQIAIYALSFIVIAITWLNHHIMFSHIDKVTATIIWINFAMLFSMSFIPLATSHLGEHFFQHESHMLYGAILAAVALPYTLLQFHVNKLIQREGQQDREMLNKLNWMATLLYVISIPLSILSIYISSFIYLLFPIVYFVLPKKMVHLY